MIRAKITGVTAFQEVIKEVNEKNLKATLEEAVKIATELTREYAPRKTGDLEESIHYIKDADGKYQIIVDVPYAEAMEYGTKYFEVGSVANPRSRTSTSGKPCFHPFMRPAVWQTMNEFPDIVKRALFSGSH